MAIEIKELHIRVNVNESQGEQITSETGSDNRNSIIAACVEQVLEILSKKEER